MDAEVIDVLQRASSQDPNVLKPAEQMLKEWETQRGFYTVLYNIFSNHSIEMNVRWMAIICFKTGVERYWRKNAPNGIGEDEKEFLRQHLIAQFNEPINQLANHIAIVIGKIARLDCPREWNSLIPILLNGLQSQNALERHRALLTLYHVMKTLATKRLIADRKCFEQLTNNMFNLILDLWNSYTESFLILMSNMTSGTEAEDALTMALLLLKILRKCITIGFPNISKREDAMLFLKLIFTKAKACLECRKNLLHRGIQIEALEKFIVHLIKVHYGAIENHSKCYVELIPVSLEFVVFYCFTEEGKSFTFEKFIIQCLKVMNTILIHNNYRPPSANVEIPSIDNVSVRATELKRNFFTPEVVKDICSKLVTHYFLLTQDDLEMWDTDPENYAVEDCYELWKYNLRAITETVFLTMYPQSCEVINSVLIDLMQRYYQPVDPNDYHAILMKDAVYLAVGLAAFDLYDEIDFNQWFSTTLKDELELKNNNYRIIRRRVCWLIGKWTQVQFSGTFKPELYKLLIEVLSPEEDLVVRLEASNTLKQALDDFQFHTDEFMPFVGTTFSLLFLLLREVSECDTKMQVLSVLSYIMKRVGDGIKPHVGPLSAYLPSLWEISENHDMMRCAIISTLVHYVKALKSESVVIEPMIINVVSLSCDLKQDAHVYLMEDAIDLWYALLETAPVPSPDIMRLIYNMPELLDSGLDQDTFQQAINVTKAYVILNPQELLGDLGIRIIASLKSIMSDLRDQGLMYATEFFLVVLKVSPEIGGHLLKPVLGRLLKKIFFDGENPSFNVIRITLNIVSRLLLNNRAVFAELIHDLANEIGGEQTEEAIMDKILEVWLDLMPYFTQSDEMKRIALALCSLISIDSPPIIHHHFPIIITFVVGVLNDIIKLDDTDSHLDSLLLVHLEDNEEITTKLQLLAKRFDLQDPVYTVCLRSFLENQLINLNQSIRHNQFEEIVALLQPDIEQQLKKYISF